MSKEYVNLLDASEILEWFEKVPIPQAEMMADLAVKAVMKRKRPRRDKKKPDDKQKTLDV